MSRIIVTGDTSSAVQAMQQLRAEMQAQEQAAQQLTLTQSRFNRNMQLTQQTVVGMTEANRQFTQSFRVVDGALTRTNTVIQDSITVRNRFIQQQKELAVAQQAPFVYSLTQRPTTQLTDDSAQRLRNLQAQLARQLSEAPNVSQAQVQQMLRELEQGTARMQVGLKGQIQNTLYEIVKLYRQQGEEIKKINDLQSKTHADAKQRITDLQQELRLKQQLDTAEASIRAKVPLKTGAKLADISGYEQAIARLRQLLAEGKLTQQQLDGVLNSKFFNKGSQALIPQGISPEALRSFEQLRSALDGVTDRSKKLYLNITEISRSLQYNLFNNMFFTITNALSEGIEKAQEYQKQLSLIRTIAQDNQLAFGTWSEGIRQVSDQLGLPVGDVAAATYSAISNQVVKGAESFKFMSEAGKFARTTMTSMEDSVNLLSSVFNNYNLSVSDAEETSAKLFKIIELGRVRGSEMANTIGRVNFLARGLGVSFDEVGAAITTLTVQGVKYSDASTLITNVLLKMYKPTEDMKKLIQSWGFESAQTAVKTLGFAEVLKRLSNEARSGNIELSQIFNELRGLKGAEGLTKAFDDYEKSLGKIKDSVKDYQDAVKIGQESPAVYLEKEYNKLKNIFSVDIGQFLVRTTSEFFKFTNGVSGAVSVLSGLIGTLVVYRGVVITTTAVETRRAAAAAQVNFSVLAQASATTSATAATTANTAATTANTGAAVANSRAAGLMSAAWKAIPWLAVAAGITVVTERILNGRQNLANLGGDLESLNDTLEKRRTRDVSGTPENQAAKQEFENLKQRILDGGKVVSSVLAELAKKNSQSMLKTQEDIKLTGDAVDSGFKKYTDALNGKINEFRSRASQAKQEIKDSFRFLTSLSVDVQRTVYGAQFQLADQFQKVQLIDQESNRRQAEAKRLVQEAVENQKKALSASTPEEREESAKKADEQLREARQMIKDLVDLRTQAHNIRTEIDKAAFEEYLRQNPSEAQRPGGNIFIGNTQQLRAELDSLYAFSLEGEKAIRNEQHLRFKEAEEARKKEEGRVRDLQKAFKDFQDFSVINKDGNLKPEFERGATGQVDQEKANRELDRRMAAVKKFVAEGKLSAADAIRFELDLQQLFNLRKKELREIDVRDTISKQQFLSNQAAEQSQKRLEDAKKESQSAQEILKTNLNRQEEFARRLRDTFNTDNYDKIRNTISFETQDKIRDILGDLDLYIKKVDEVKKKAKLDPLTGNLVPETRDLIGLNNFQNLIQSKINQLDKTGLAFFERVAGTSVTGKEFSARDVFSGLEATGEDSLRQRQVIGRAALAPKLEEKRLDSYKKEVLDPLKTAFPDLVLAAEEANKRVENSFTPVEVKVKSLIQTIRDLKQELQNIQGQKISMGEGSDAMYAASGAYFPGSPRGRDRIPVWAAPGEMMISAENTARYFTTLQKINAGTYPRYMEGGGVVNNVGDIHVSMNASGNLDYDLKQLGQGLRRQLRRGTIKLS